MIKRYLSEKVYERFLKDYKFLFNKIKESDGELDLKLRDDYFNLYYKGYSLAKIELRNTPYKISINKKFSSGVYEKDSRFGKCTDKNDYQCFSIDANLLHAFLQNKYMKRLFSNIKEVNSGAEVTFEQMLITDNIEREDFFIIDRQISETTLKRKRLDLLAIKQNKDNKYHFVVLEVKLGNNKELKKEVGKQLDSYKKHIDQHFHEWKDCYEKNYQQMKKTNIFEKPHFEKIEIENKTEGIVVVGGYSGLGETSIKELKKKYPGINVKLFKNQL